MTINANWWFFIRRDWCAIRWPDHWIRIHAPRETHKVVTFLIWCRWASTIIKYHFKMVQSFWSTCANRHCTDSTKCVRPAVVFAWLTQTKKIWQKSTFCRAPSPFPWPNLGFISRFIPFCRFKNYGSTVPEPILEDGKLLMRFTSDEKCNATHKYRSTINFICDKYTTVIELCAETAENIQIL